MFVQGSHTFAMLYAHAYMGIHVTHAHITLMTFTRFAQNSMLRCILALYGPTMQVATLKPYKAMNLAR